MSYLVHHGIKGMKWGVRRYQNADGTLTPEGERRYGRQVRRQERKAIRAYKERAEYRRSTGENYDRVRNELEERVKNDKKYQELSKKASDYEYERLLMEKPLYGKNIYDDEADYDRLYSSKAYRDATNKSRKAANAKDKYIAKLVDSYADKFKDAALDDLKITDESRELAKKYIKSSPGHWANYSDEHYEYNPDSYYVPGMDSYEKWSKGYGG
jgi:hypothetical protein